MAYPLRTMFLPRDWFLLFVLSMSLLDTVTMSNVCQESRNGSSNIHQASVNQSVTVTVTLNSNVSLNSSSVHLRCLKDDVIQFVVEVCNGVETAEAQDQQSRGQFQCNITKEGCVQLIMSRLTTKDSGPYWCRLFFSDSQDRTYGWFVLNVTSGLTHEEQHDATTLQTPTVTTHSWVWVLVLVLTVLVLVLTVLAVVLILKHKHSRRTRNVIKYDPAPTKEPFPA